MAFSFGAALSTLGAGLRQNVKDMQDYSAQEIERKQKEAALAVLAQTLKKNQEDTTRRADAENKLLKYTTDTNRANLLNQIKGVQETKPIEADPVSQLPDDYSAGVPDYRTLGRLGSLKPIEQAQSYGLPAAAANSPEVEKTVDLIRSEQERQDRLDAAKAEAEATRQFREAEAEKDRTLRGQLAQIGADSRSGTISLNHAEKQEQNDNKRFENFSKTIDPSQASSRSSVGVAALKYNTAERLESLGKAFTNGNAIRDAEMEELAMGVANLLSGTSASARSQVEALVPKTAIGNAMKLKQWLLNAPQGLQQKAFVDRMMGTIEREKNTVADQLKRAQFARIAPFKNLKDVDPERYNEVLMSSGVDPDEYEKWVSGGYTHISAVQKPEDAKGAETGAIKKISSDAEYGALPSGALFIDPEGNQRRKP